MLRSLCRCATTALTSGLELHRNQNPASGLELHRNQNPELYSTASDSSTFVSRLPPSKCHGTRRKRSVQARPEPPRRNSEQIAAAMKVFVVSDVHSDYDANMDWLRSLSSTQYKQDTLICAGDVTDNLEIFQTSMSLLKGKFRDVFFVPGNHDLWCRRKEDNVDDSLVKLEALTAFCNSVGIHTAPAQINGVWIVPLLSWHHQSWDRERDIEGYNIPPVFKKCTDFSACKWPPPLDNLTDSVAQHFDDLNVLNLQGLPALQEANCQVITFSHFLPRFELCPEKRMLFYPNLPKMVGSDWLEARLRSIHGLNGSSTACHIFGHTHFAWDATLEGIRYIQAPLGYPREREHGQLGDEKALPLCIYDSENGGLIAERLRSRWVEYYRTHTRDPDNQKFAPWVEGNYQPVTDSSPQLIKNANR